MPTVLRVGGYQLIMFTSDHPPAHVHVRREGRLAKVQLDPVQFARTGGFNAREQSTILEIVRSHQEMLLAEWSKLFPQELSGPDEQ